MCVKYVFKVSIPEVPSSNDPKSVAKPSALSVSPSVVLAAETATNALPQIVTPGVGVVSAPSSARPVKSNSANAVFPVIVKVSTSSPVE